MWSFNSSWVYQTNFRVSTSFRKFPWAFFCESNRNNKHSNITLSHSLWNPKLVWTTHQLSTSLESLWIFSCFTSKVESQMLWNSYDLPIQKNIPRDPMYPILSLQSLRFVNTYEWKFQDPKMEVRKRTIFLGHMNCGDLPWNLALNHRPYISGWWFQSLWKKNVSWDDDIPNWMDSHKIPWFQTTNQYVYVLQWWNHIFGHMNCQEIPWNLAHNHTPYIYIWYNVRPPR